MKKVVYCRTFAQIVYKKLFAAVLVPVSLPQPTNALRTSVSGFLCHADSTFTCHSRESRERALEFLLNVHTR
jgi:hypothetical protein